MTPYHLTTIALNWLRFTQRCWIITDERAIWHGFRPDAIGVKKMHGGYVCVEVEVKTTMTDFRNNAFKRCMEQRAQGWAYFMPWKYYFCVPPQIADAVLAELPTGAGLLVPTDVIHYGLPVLECRRGATPEPGATRLDVDQIARMVQKMGNALISARKQHREAF